MADDLPVGGAADREVGDRKAHFRACLSRRGARLRHIGAGIFADVEAFVCGPHLLVEEEDVAAADLQNGDVADHVRVSLRRLEEDVLDGVAQELPARQHPGLGLADGIRHAESGEEILVNGERDLVVENGLLPRQPGDIARVEGRLVDDVDHRQAGAARDRDVFVVGSRLRPGCIDLRIVGIGGRQRLRHTLRQRLGCGGEQDNAADGRDECQPDRKHVVLDYAAQRGLARPEFPTLITPAYPIRRLSVRHQQICREARLSCNNRLRAAAGEARARPQKTNSRRRANPGNGGAQASNSGHLEVSSPIRS